MTHIALNSINSALDKEQVRAKVKEKLKAKLKEQGYDIYIFRKPAAELAGISPRTAANYDSLGIGPNKIMIGGSAAYLVDNYIEWLVNRIA